MWDKIKDIIIKTIISSQEKLVEKLEADNLNDRSFYNLLGFDILVKENFEPILLEVNNSPCMNIYNKVDVEIKTNLLVDILNILGIYPFTDEMKNYKKNVTNNIEANIIESVNNAFCELYRPRGFFELIFPLKENIKKYDKYFRNNISRENKLFWDEILK